jgi:hypothetical protein
MKQPQVTKIVKKNSEGEKYSIYEIKVGSFNIRVSDKEAAHIDIDDLSVYIDNSTNERLVYTQINSN